MIETVLSEKYGFIERMLQGRWRKTLKWEHRIIKKKYLELSDLQSCNNYVGGEVKWNKTRCMKSYKVGKLLNDLNDLYAKNSFEDIRQFSSY